MNYSVVVICGTLYHKKLLRLFNSLCSQIDLKNTEVLLLHETELPGKPELPLPFRYIPLRPKQGIAYNRNKGIEEAQGEIIIFIDDDCWVTTNWFENIVAPFQDTNILAVTSGTKIPPSTFLGNCISALGFPGGGSLGFEKMWPVSKRGFTRHLAVGNCALRREIFPLVGMFDESMKQGAEDAEFSFRLEKNRIPVRYVPSAYAYHEARTALPEFIRWHLRRGRANYQFRRRVGNVQRFVALRLWSTKNILKENLLKWRFPVIASLLGLSFILQQVGFFREKMRGGRR